MTEDAPHEPELTLLDRRLDACEAMASAQDNNALMGLADLLAIHTGRVVTREQAKKIWIDLLHAGWDEPSVAIEPVTPTTLHPEVMVETVRARCCTCGHPLTGVGALISKRPHAERDGVLTTKIELEIEHACPVARDNCERAAAEARERDRRFHEQSREALIEMLVKGGWSREHAEEELAAVVVAAVGVNT